MHYTENGRGGEELFNYQEGEDKVYIPNEIFVDFVGCEDIKSGSHVAFAYSYYWLISWLYRYAKYGSVEVTVPKIKEKLQYSKTDARIDYLIKKNGVLDQLGYTATDTDFPVLWNYRDNELTFDMLSEAEYKNDIVFNKGRNYKIKVPVKGLHRTTESLEDNYEDGTFFEVDNTHLIEYEVFDKCMSDKLLGCKAFYIYGYLKCNTQWHSGKYNHALSKIGEELRLSRKTVTKYIEELKRAELITSTKNDCLVVNGEIKQQANTYQIG